MISIIYFISIMIIPVTAIIAGYMMKYRPPEKINKTVGYRTRRSRASQEAWDFANRYCGKNTLIFGAVSLILSMIAGYFMFFGTGTIFKEMGLMIAVMFVQMILLIVVMAVPTELQLKKRYE